MKKDIRVCMTSRGFILFWLAPVSEKKSPSLATWEELHMVKVSVYITNTWGLIGLYSLNCRELADLRVAYSYIRLREILSGRGACWLTYGLQFPQPKPNPTTHCLLIHSQQFNRHKQPLKLLISSVFPAPLSPREICKSEKEISEIWGPLFAFLWARAIWEQF
jgi:hypothetical protein